jgi:hypothetical protein
MSDEAAAEIEVKLARLMARAKDPGLGVAEFEELLATELIAIHRILVERRSRLAKSVDAEPVPPKSGAGGAENKE